MRSKLRIYEDEPAQEPESIPEPEPPAPEPEAPAPETPEEPGSTQMANPSYLVVALPSHEGPATELLAQKVSEGYTQIVGIYSITAPSGASTAFAVLRK